jgi:glycosyltransferase involved in cell wall biosynthesis
MHRNDMIVCYVHANGNNFSGQERVLADIIRTINKKSFKPFVVLSTDGIFASYLKHNGISTRIIRLNNISRRNAASFIITVLKLFAFFRHKHIDIVHTSGLLPNQYCIMAAKLARIPCICHVHSSIYNQYDIKRSFARYASVVIAVSQGVKRLLCTSIKESMVEVVYNGIDECDYQPDRHVMDSLRSELGIDGTATIVCQIGQVVKHKGIEDFLRMASLLHQRMSSTIFLIVGDDKYEPGYSQRMMALSKELGIHRRVIFAGFRKEIPELISISDVIVLASTVEGHPMILLEAMLLGKPVVATDIPGTDEVIDNNHNGILVPMNDCHALANSVELILRDGELRRRFLDNGKATIRTHFSLETQTAKIETIYNRLYAQYRE